ncbi:unnamed protein product [Prorocentrum cordatum]|uniref:C3H1-type domain-containing protein n=1 Tax=Prorocentrum cordatum TaxID=2364126 RepID=A0ABN9Q606_9DINO|nr:unnamed protein product [Polarella glacialis]
MPYQLSCAPAARPSKGGTCQAVTVETLESLEALELTAAAARGPPDSLRKTKLCKFHLRSRCSRGELCSYAHSVHELSPLPDLYKTRLCYSYVRLGSCEDAKCRHAHGVAESCVLAAR